MVTSMHFGAKKDIILFARQLRLNMTPAEKELWFHISKKSLQYRFRNQHPLYKYVVDFYCHSLKLIIEVDGEIHTLEDVAENDAYRENQLLSFGLHIIRFTNFEIFNDIQNVLYQIKLKIKSILESTTTQTHSPLLGI